MAHSQPGTFLQRLLGTAPAVPSVVAVPHPSEPDPADLGTAYGLDLSFAQQAYARPLPPASTPRPPKRR